jgi:uroporphyrinogen-III synthase
LTDRQRQAVLVTRPEPGASETAARLSALGFDPVLAPALRIRPLPARLPDPAGVAALLVTSGQAIPAIPHGYHGIRLFAVGDSTATRARQAGFANVTSAAGDATDLAALVGVSLPQRAAVLLITGRGLGSALAATLRGAGFAVMRRCVYAPIPVRRLPAPALSALRSGRLRAAMFFSADTATRFATMLSQDALYDTVMKTDAVAISKGTAVALNGLPWRRILVAARPNQDAMLALLQ